MVEVVGALIFDENRFLICRRPAHKARGLLWEFVGGKVERGESKGEALIRECREELNILVEPLEEFMTVEHEYPDIKVRLTIINCRIVGGQLQLLEHSEIKWIAVDEIKNYDFCPADRDILKRITELYGV